MSSKLIKLIIAIVVAVVLGYVSYPVFNLGGSKQAKTVVQAPTPSVPQVKPQEPQPVKPQPEETTPTEPSEDTTGNDEQKGFEETTVQEEDEATEDGDNSFMFSDGDPDLRGIAEEKDAPSVEGQTDVVPPAPQEQKLRAITTAARSLADALQDAEKETKQPQTPPTPEFTEEAWKDPVKIYKTVADRVLKKIGQKPTAEDMIHFLGDAGNRKDVALISLCRKAGMNDLKELVQHPMGARLLSTLSADPEWLCNTMFSGPTDKLGRGLRYMTAIFSDHPDDLMDPTSRRIATTAATEFAREDWDKEGMLARYDYYNTIMCASLWNVT